MTTSLGKIEKNLHHRLASIDAALLIADASGKIEFTNQRLCDLLSLSRELLEGRQIADVFFSPKGEPLSDQIREAIETSSQPWTGTLQAQVPAGKEIRLTANFNVIQTSTNRIGILVVLLPLKQLRSDKGLAQQSTAAEIQSMIVARLGGFTAGHLEMIGLDEVRASLGDRWEKLTSRVYEIADSILKRKLSSEDVFRRDGGGNYIICFAHLCDEQAWFKAKAIRQEIQETLIGEESKDPLVEFKLDADTRERLCIIKAETYEIDVPSDELDDIPDIMGLIKKKIDNASSRLREHAGSLLTMLTDKCSIQFLGVKGLTGKQMPFQIAEFGTASQERVERLQNIYNDAPKLMAQLDSLLLCTTIESMYNVDPKRLPVILVDVNFATMGNPKTAQDYFNLCSSVIGKPAESLIIKVKNIPPDLPQVQISDVLRSLRKYSRVTAIQLTTPSLDNIDITNIGLSFASVEFWDLTLMLRRNTKDVVQMIEHLRQNNVRIAVNNVSDDRALIGLKSLAPNYYTMRPLT